MSTSQNGSLLLRLGLAMAGIFTLAFIGLLSSVFTADMTQGYAAAINQAGSLRMQAYRIATNVMNTEERDIELYWQGVDSQVSEFDQRLRSPRLVNVMHQNDVFKKSYDSVVREWETTILPMLLHETSDTSAGQKSPASEVHAVQEYLSVVDRFVLQIDDLVKILEEDTESKIQHLRLIQVIILFMTLALVIRTMYLINTRVLAPLRELLDCAQGARRGDFSVRTLHTTEDELGQLGYAFNLMAEDLSKIYSDLEARVQKKTSDLERSNLSLDVLYNTIRHLSEAPLLDSTYGSLLREVEQRLGLGPGNVCLSEEFSEQPYKLASSYPVTIDKQRYCAPEKCATCIRHTTTTVLTIPNNTQGASHVIVTPIKDQEKHYGVLVMEIPPGKLLEEWQTRLLEAVAQHIGMALNITQRVLEKRRLALFEERSVIARELHDSLAQSLSYLKIQISRLEAALAKPDNEAAARPIIGLLREGIGSAYRQLRELLTTFRLSLEGGSLHIALLNTVEDFRSRSNVQITLDNQLDSHQLSVNQEIHVHQIIREALANVVHHSQAQHAKVALAKGAEGKVVVSIEDDGVGIPESAQRLHHYGLAIMEERAHTLKGEMRITRRPEGGTRVELVFPAAVSL
ncbi:MAG: ATP-binding protein [Pseudomonadota bacterium]